jgi:hypothetical protein
MAELSGSTTTPGNQAAPSGSGDLGGVDSFGTDRIRGPRDGAWPLSRFSLGRRITIDDRQGSMGQAGVGGVGGEVGPGRPARRSRMARIRCPGCPFFLVQLGGGDSGDSGGSDSSRCWEKNTSHAKPIRIVMECHRATGRAGIRTSRTSRLTTGAPGRSQAD